MNNEHDPIKKTKDFISTHLDTTITLDTLSQAIGYSKAHLNRLFAAETGQTIHQYIQIQRLTRAAEALASDPRPIAVIAQEAGYTNQQAFSFAFRQRYHCSPQQYRQQHRQKPHCHLSMRRTAA